MGKCRHRDQSRNRVFDGVIAPDRSSERREPINRSFEPKRITPQLNDARSEMKTSVDGVGSNA